MPREAAVALIAADASDRLQLRWDVTSDRVARGTRGDKVVVEVAKRGREYGITILSTPPWPARLMLAALRGVTLLEEPLPPIDTSKGRVPIGNRLRKPTR